MPSEIFQLLERDRHYRSHQEHLRKIKAKHSQPNPDFDRHFRITRSRQRNLHLQKREQNELIGRENEFLLEKILKLNMRRQSRHEPYADFQPHNYQEQYRREQYRIIEQNEIIARKLVGSSPKINARELERQFRATRGHSQRLQHFVIDQDTGEVISKQRRLAQLALTAREGSRETSRTISLGVARGFYPSKERSP